MTKQDYKELSKEIENEMRKDIKKGFALYEREYCYYSYIAGRMPNAKIKTCFDLIESLEEKIYEEYKN